MQTPEQLKATAQTLIELAEKLEKEKEAARPWMPNNGDWFFSLWHDGARRRVDYLRYYGNGSSQNISARVTAGNCYRTESEAQDVADQRNFIERCLKAGDVSGNIYAVEIIPVIGERIVYISTSAISAGNKFSSIEKARAFVDSEGGEAEFVKKFSRGWV